MRMNVIKNLRPAVMVISVLFSSGSLGEMAEAEDTLSLLTDYVRVDTSNPPGNESRAVDFFARILDAEGITYETAEVAPGRGNLWARLPGGDQPALILLHHMDVVPADPARWQHHPFAGEVANGFLHGRGALDTKSLGIFHLQAFLALHRAGKPLNRDVIFLATADEEAGGALGVGWLLEHHPELLDGVGAVFNEGGYGELYGDSLTFAVEVTQKVPLWLRLEAKNEPGHGATPRTDSAVNRLVRALARIEQFEFPARLIPPVEQYLKGIAAITPAPWGKRFADPGKMVGNTQQLRELHSHDHRLHALLRSTCAVTRLAGSEKINSIPGTASAELDCRLLPDQEPEQALQVLTTVVNDPEVVITTLLNFGAGVSATDDPAYRAIETTLQRDFPDALVLPKVAAGFTDSHYFRERGIAAYGFSPIIVSNEERDGVHGDNEKLSVDDIERGAQLMSVIVNSLVYDAPATP